jgi:hypothetical protein
VKLLNAVAPAAFGLVCIEAIVSIRVRLPYQFTGQGDPDRMLWDFAVYGTLLSPPLPLLLLFGLAALTLRRDDRLGAAATGLLAVLCAVMTVGSLGEALAPKTPDVSPALQLISGLLNALLFAALFALALAARHERSRSAHAA